MTSSLSSYYFAIIAVIALKLLFLCCWIIGRANKSSERRNVVLVQQSNGQVIGIENPQNVGGVVHAPYPTQFAQPGAHMVNEYPKDLPPSYEEAQKMSSPYPQQHQSVLNTSS